jgi:hypothetical protein
MAAPNTRSGPALVVFDPFGTPITFTRSQQMRDLSIKVNRTSFPHTTQESALPSKLIKTGIEMVATISLADITVTNLGLILAAPVTTNGANKAIQLSDEAGDVIEGQVIQFTPYIGAAVSTDPNDQITFLNGVLTNPNSTELTFGLQTQQMVQAEYTSYPEDITRVRVVIGALVDYAPTITNGTVAEGTVTLTGTGFLSTKVVKSGSVEKVFTVVSDTTLTFAGNLTSTVHVTNAFGTADYTD